MPQEQNEFQNNGKQLNNNTYRKHTGDSVTNHKNTEHLSKDERKSLGNLMSQFEGLFRGTVGDYKEIGGSSDNDKAKTPYHTKRYRIPVTHMPLMKKTISEMVENKALILTLTLIFGAPKNNNGVKIVTDFRKLNDKIKQSLLSIPTIQDMLHQYGGMTYATALDMIQSYYAMNVKKNMQKNLVIIQP